MTRDELLSDLKRYGAVELWSSAGVELRLDGDVLRIVLGEVEIAGRLDALTIDEVRP